MEANVGSIYGAFSAFVFLFGAVAGGRFEKKEIGCCGTLVIPICKLEFGCLENFIVGGRLHLCVAKVIKDIRDDQGRQRILEQVGR